LIGSQNVLIRLDTLKDVRLAGKSWNQVEIWVAVTVTVVVVVAAVGVAVVVPGCVAVNWRSRRVNDGGQ
jgi:signal transduction histidine kinase